MSNVNIARAACLKTLHEEREQEGHRPTAFGTLGRGSMAGGCDRALALDMMLVVAVISLLYIWLTRKVTENIA